MCASVEDSARRGASRIECRRSQRSSHPGGARLEIATPKEAREILKLKGGDRVGL
jgi:hypothetical protein